MGDLLRKARALASHCNDDSVDRQEGTAQAPPFRLHDGDIRLLAELEEVVLTMRRGADDLEQWGRCAQLDRAEKVRRLAALVGALNQQLSAEVTRAVAALADINASQTPRLDHDGVSS